MPGQTEQRKGGKNLSTSERRKQRYVFYKSNQYSKNKLKRIVRSCGMVFAQKWAMEHSCVGVLARMK
jgi:hypothetical protein